MTSKLCILTMVDLSEGAPMVPEVKGVYRAPYVAKNNAIILLCEKASCWGLPESSIDTANLRLSDETGTKCVQMGYTEVLMTVEPTFGTIH